MKKLLLTTALVLAATPAFAKEVIVKEITDDKTGKAYFSPDNLTVQPGDTVTFENAQDSPHEVMFVNVPKQVDEMIMSPMQDKKGDKFS
jgi:plastocyanin